MRAIVRDLVVWDDFWSRAEGVRRTVRVFRPSGWRSRPAGVGGVLIAQDGQNLFGDVPATASLSWGLDALIERLGADPAIGPWLVVGVDHRERDRIEDYAPWPDRAHSGGARCDAYAHFIVHELLPHLGAEVGAPRDPERVAVLGSSMGGLAALYVAASFPDRIGRVAALSPTAMWDSEGLCRWWTHAHGRGLRIYIDAGEREELRVGDVHLDYGTSVAALARHLHRLGYRERDLRVVLEPDGDHSEESWRRRLPGALAWLLRRADAPAR
jgi:enterochelin esterase-like enzyme